MVPSHTLRLFAPHCPSLVILYLNLPLMSLHIENFLALYSISWTCPDIAYVVSKLSQFMHCPTQLHWESLKHLMRDLKSTIYFGLPITPHSGLDFHAFSNVD